MAEDGKITNLFNNLLSRQPKENVNMDPSKYLRDLADREQDTKKPSIEEHLTTGSGVRDKNYQLLLEGSHSVNSDTATQRVSKNIPLAEIRASGIDFIKSNFDVYIVLYNGTDSSILSLGLDGARFFGSRFTTVSLPQEKAKTFQLKCGLSTIEKVSSAFEMSYQAQLNIRMDDNFDVYNIFTRAGNTSDLSKDCGYGLKEYQRILPATFINISGNLNKHGRIDIVVKNRNLMADALEEDSASKQSYENTVSSKIIEANHQKPTSELSYWIFEDVRFVGFSNSMVFNHESAEVQIMPIDFIYKRMILERDNSQANWSTKPSYRPKPKGN